MLVKSIMELADAITKRVSKKVMDIDIQKKAQALFRHGYIFGKFPVRLPNKFSNIPNVNDMFRFTTLYLLAREIELKGLTGSIAELGVYRGDFSVHIRNAFPESKYYLFDTFSGFDQKQASADVAQYGSKIPPKAFTNTSVDMVIKRIGAVGNVSNCIVKKGTFPDSLEGLEDTFSFVSIDPDLYEPTWSGLEYFYPRLLGGGYILIHDSGEVVPGDKYPGCRLAVMDFVKKHGLPFVPVADWYRSIVISKGIESAASMKV